VYRELGPDDHRRVLGIERDEVPDVLLVVGVFDVHNVLERRFTRYIEEPRRLERFPAWLGTKHGLKVALAGALGGPMAAMHVHTFCGAGVPTVVQLGWYGALQPGSSLGDVVVPRHAERQDGVSDWYLSKGILADASPGLSSEIASRLRERGVAVSEHAIFTTPALLAESREVIADWSRHGWQGVDMETAATFGVAKALGAERAAALIRMDDLVAEEDSIAEEWPRERLRFIRAREQLVAEVAMEAVSALGRRAWTGSES
jgi:uridine phosphorylase